MVWTGWKKKNSQSLMRDYNEDDDKGYFLEVDVEYQKDLSTSHKDLPFLRLRYKWHRTICCSYKNFKTSIKSRLKIKRGTQSNSI